MTLTNDVAELSGVVMLTSADVTLDTDGRNCSFKSDIRRIHTLFIDILYLNFVMVLNQKQGSNCIIDV